ncbi:hypothetical protein B0H11DRAFT_2255535 [Mycena galericulata]|nr:hypothetical protein B0H11DRAFT_2255535 [Mycena galericulata]
MSAPTRPINKTTPISDWWTEQVERSTPRPESTKVSRRRASAKYRERNADELREKARERMAKVRQRNSEDVSLADAARARAREDSKKYREKHADALAHRKRIMRME